MRLLQRLRAQTHARQGGEATLERDVLLGPQPFHHLQRLVGACAAFTDRHPTRFELFRVFATDPDSQVETSARDDVESGDLLGQQGRWVERHQSDRAHQPDVPGRTGGGGQQDQPIVHRPMKEDVLAGRHEVISQPLRLSRVDGHIVGATQADAELDLTHAFLPPFSSANMEFSTTQRRPLLPNRRGTEFSFRPC